MFVFLLQDPCPQMFEGIKDMARESGRDPNALELIVRANVEVYDSRPDKDRPDFTGTLDQIAGDIMATQGLGAAELLLDIQFSPGVEGINDIVSLMDKLWNIAK